MAGRYEVLRVLGEGTSGVVHLARDPEGRPVALKILKRAPDGDLGPASIEAFRAEFAILAALGSPNVVQVYDFGAVGQPPTYYIASQYVDGLDLATYAARGAAVEDVVRAAIDVLRGLAHVHASGLVHLDVKPENIRVVEDLAPSAPGRVIPRAVLVDFGLARRPEDRGGLLALEGIGSVRYAAPEVLRGDEIDGRADLYSLGATLYHVLCGAPPFAAQTGLEMLRLVLSGRLPPPRARREDLSPALETVLLRLLAKEPAERFGSALEAAAALRDALPGAGAPGSLEPEGLRPPLLKARFAGRAGEWTRLREAFDRAIADPPKGIETRALDRRAGLERRTARAPASEGGERRASSDRRRNDDRRSASPGSEPRPLGPRLALIDGPPGAGKSRLLRELVIHAKLAGALTAFSSAEQADLIRPHGTAAAVLSSLVPALEGSASAVSVSAILERLSGGTPGGSGWKPVEALVDVVLEVARARPLLIAVDDLETASEETVALLRELERSATALCVPSLGGSPPPLPRIFIAVAARSGGQAALRELARAAGGGRRSIELDLAPLGDDAVGELVRSTLGTGALPREISAAIARDAGGIPLCVEERVRALALERRLVRRGSGLELSPDPLPEAPGMAGARELVGLGALDAPVLATASVLALLMVPSRLEVIARAAGITAELARERLSTLVERGFVEVRHGGAVRGSPAGAQPVQVSPEFRFRHRAVRDALCARAADPAELHAATLAALRDVPDAAEGRAILARHALAQADHEIAVRFGLAAAEDARSRGAPGRARRFYRLALERAERGLRDVPRGGGARRSLAAERIAALEALGEACLSGAAASGHEELEQRTALGAEASSVYERVAQSARRRGDPLAEARALERRGRAEVLAERFEAAGDALSQAASVAAGARDALLEAEARRALGDLALRRGGWDAALTELERARELAESVLASQEGRREDAQRAATEAARYLRAIGRALFGKGACVEARSYAERAVAIVERAGDRAALPETLELLSDTAFFLGDDKGAIEARDRAASLARELGDRSGLASSLYGLALVYGGRGDLEGAREHYRQALELWRRLDDRCGLGRALGGLGEVGLLRGDLEEAAAALNEAATIENEAGGGEAYAAALVRLGLAYLGLGEPARALACTRQAARAARRSGSAALEAEALPVEAEASALRGDLLEAADAFERALAAAGDDEAYVETRALALAGLSRVHLRRGEPAEARARLAAAESALARIREGVSAPEPFQKPGGDGARSRTRAVLPLLEAAIATAAASVEAHGGELSSARRRLLRIGARQLRSATPRSVAADAGFVALAVGDLELAGEVAKTAREPWRGAIQGSILLARARASASNEASALLSEARARLCSAYELSCERGLDPLGRETALELSRAAALDSDPVEAARWLSLAAPEGALEDRVLAARAAIERVAAANRAGDGSRAQELELEVGPIVHGLGSPAIEADLELASCASRRLRGDRAGAREALMRAEALVRAIGEHAREIPGANALREAEIAGELRELGADAVQPGTGTERSGALLGRETPARDGAVRAAGIAKTPARIAVEGASEAEAPALLAALAGLPHAADAQERVALIARAASELSGGAPCAVALFEEARLRHTAAHGSEGVSRELSAALRAAALGDPIPEGTLVVKVSPQMDSSPAGAIAIHPAPDDPSVARRLAPLLDLVSITGALAALETASLRVREERDRAARSVLELEARVEASEREKQVKLDEANRALELSRRELQSKYNYANIVGRSEAMRSLFLVLDKITDTEVAVLIQGESGTGKELVSKAIHFNGGRRTAPFLSINCAAFPETLLEAELFGHVRGAFTGADRDKVGLFEAANQGTLFLDEVGEMSPGMQAKLLRVLQEGEVRPVGGKVNRKIDVRIISASNQDLRSMIQSGKFRMDLFYRLNVINVTLPPLRERREDIPLLVERFIARDVAAGEKAKEIAPGVLEALLSYHWPGNVRELENEIRRAVALSGPSIGPADLSPHIKKPNIERYDIGHPEGLTLKARLEILERRILKDALARTNGNKTRCAQDLGLSRFGFLKKLDKYGLR